MTVTQQRMRVPRWLIALVLLSIFLNIVQIGLTFRYKIYHLIYQLQADILQPSALTGAIGNQELVVQSNRDRNMDDIYYIHFNSGGQPETVKNLTTGLDGASTFPVWSPDGQWIAFEFRPRIENPRVLVLGDPAIYVMRADGSERQELTAGSSPTWSPDSKTVFFTRLYRDETLQQDRGDIWSYDLTSKEATKVMDSQKCRCIDYEYGVVIFANWQPLKDTEFTLFQLQSDSWYPSIYRWDSVIEQAYPLDMGTGYYGGNGFDPVYSRSGMIAYGQGFGTTSVITNNSISVSGGSPSWSPDGKYVVFDGLNGDRWQINIMPADNSVSPRPILADPQVNYAHPSWRRS